MILTNKFVICVYPYPGGDAGDHKSLPIGAGRA